MFGSISASFRVNGPGRRSGIRGEVELSKDTKQAETWCIMNVAEAEKNFAKLVDKVYAEGISVDLERDNKVIARLTPAEPRSQLTVGELNAFLRSLPPLGDDAVEFARDVRAIRAQFPAETDPWD